MTIAEQRSDFAGPAILSFGFRPFFLLSSLLAAIIVPVWLLGLTGKISAAGAIDLQVWHGHELLFGYTGGVIAGFALTAVPNWTKRLPVRGRPLGLIAGLWLIGRIALWYGTWIGTIEVASVEGIFLVALTFLLAREILAGKNWRNLPIVVLIATFATANLAWHFSLIMGISTDFALGLGLSTVAMLIALIGGRVTPSFTHNWMMKAKRRSLPEPFGQFDKVVLIMTAIGLCAWIFNPDGNLIGAVMLAIGGAHLARLIRWRGWSTFAEPLIVILHIGYLWLVVGFALLGAAALFPDWIAVTTAVHGLSAGAIAVMTLAIMTRASLGHTGRPLTADWITISIYVLVNLGALARLFSGFATENYLSVIVVSGVLWSSAFALFAFAYGPMLFRPR